MDAVEQELKLVPASVELLEVLARIDQLGSFMARDRRHELQRNSFFDNAARGLERARVGFRRRTIAGAKLATWSIKGDAAHVGGIATRSEIELQLDADTPPAMALSTLRSAARTYGAAALADAVDDAVAHGGLPRPGPFLETETDRTIVELASPEAQVELALDRMRLIGHAYQEVEIEAELKQGPVESLSAVREAIAALGQVSDSHGSKLSRAVAYLRSNS
jgi:inorganic triphosphatase YgiF